MLSAESGGMCLETATRSGVMPNYTILYEVYVKKLYSIKFGYPNVNNVELRTMLNRVDLFQ